MKKKYVFVGDVNSINIEIILNSHRFLKNKVIYILICNVKELQIYILKCKSNLKINQILNPLLIHEYNKEHLNVFNIENTSKEKYKNLLNQIYICNELSKKTKFDLVTMAIDKSIFKKKMKFTGMTEYLGYLNKRNTVMLMHGNKFSIIPITTHINLKNIHKSIKFNYLKKIIENTLKNINKTIYNLNFKKFYFLCYNPHCGEKGFLGKEDYLIKKVISNFKNFSGPTAADSAFMNLKKNKPLFFSMYHDQALIPFKILNKKSFNLTIGLSYRRLSPSHGTATDIKFKNLADNTSYLECMLF